MKRAPVLTALALLVDALAASSTVGRSLNAILALHATKANPNGGTEDWLSWVQAV